MYTYVFVGHGKGVDEMLRGVVMRRDVILIHHMQQRIYAGRTDPVLCQLPGFSVLPG